ncbi:MAG: YegS/Rv2252/BmrU family lipid kinase [Eubacteriales bacterium]|nr:YegS/Rv2252/BmrU family lipid kinase [Eubacteriales bacterium]
MMMLVNPAAGRGGFRNSLGSVLHIFWEGGYQPSVFFSDSSESIADLIHDHAQNFPILVCLGGDGTLSNVISGLMTLPPERRPVLGYIPMGTANDIAATLALPRDPIKAAKHILNGEPHPFDVGYINDGDCFAYVAAFGAFTEVSYVTDQNTKQKLGHLAYVLEALNHLPRLTGFRASVRLDDCEFDGEFVFGGVFNTTSLGGVLRLNEQLVALGDGLFEVILVRTPRSAGDLNKIFAGLLTRDYTAIEPAVIVRQTQNVQFSFDKSVPWTRDGEKGGDFLSLSLKNCPQAIRIIS